MNYFNENKTLPPPNEFQIGKPDCIRAAMMEHVTYIVRKSFSDNLDDLVKNFLISNPGMDHQTAFISMIQKLDAKLKPYQSCANQLIAPIQTTLSNALELEKVNPDGAIVLYEKCVKAGSTGSTPYERLRIIYTRQKEYQKAITACQNFINTLQILQTFNSRPQYAVLIDEYNSHIAKLQLKLNKQSNR